MLPPGFSPFPADAIAELQTQRLPWPPVIQRYMVLVYRSSCIIQQSSFIYALAVIKIPSNVIKVSIYNLRLQCQLPKRYMRTMGKVFRKRLKTSMEKDFLPLPATALLRSDASEKPEASRYGIRWLGNLRRTKTIDDPNLQKAPKAT